MADPKVVKSKEERDLQKEATRNVINTALKFAPNVIINTFAVLALAFLTILVLDFDPSYIVSFRGLATSLALVTIFTSSHWSSYDMCVKALKANKENKEYIRNQETDIKKVTNTLTWFDHKAIFINERNLDKKIEAWKILVQNKITQHENKARKKDLDIECMSVTDFQREHLNDDEILQLENEIAEKKRTCRYLQRKEAYNEMLTDKWIAANIDKKNIDYNKIDVLFIETGSVIKGQEKDKVEKRGKYAKDNSGQRVFSLLISVALTAITTELFLDSFTTAAWFIFALRVVILVANILMGLNYGENYYVETDIHNVDSRKMITDEFKVWAMEKDYIKR